MRIAIVTGGSKGLGKALCLQLEQANYSLVEFSRSAPHPFSTQVDLAAPERVTSAVRSALEYIDPKVCTELVMISNAGRLDPIGPAWRNAAADTLQNLSVNISSAILIIAEVMKHFRETPCRKLVVNISSGAALKGYAGWSLYCASKAAMEGFVRALAAEEQHQPHPFLPVSVNPGVFDTDMQALIRATSKEDFPEVERFASLEREGRLRSPDSVAAGIITLISGQQFQPGGRYDVPNDA